jgi:hypothetical protein
MTRVPDAVQRAARSLLRPSAIAGAVHRIRDSGPQYSGDPGTKASNAAQNWPR